MPKKKNIDNNLLVVNMSSDKMPEFKEVTGKDWVYYGSKNDYPQYLLDLYYQCSKHNAVVNGKARWVAGAGWVNGGDTIINSDGETLDKLTYKIALDRQLYGGFAIEVIWNTGKTGAEFRHVDFSKIRSNEDNTRFYYTDEWTKKGVSTYYPNPTPQNSEDWQVYETYDINNRTGKQLIYFKTYSPGLEVYPLPEYKACIQYIELEYQISNYWYNRVKNGFMPSALINFYMGQPTDDEIRKIEEKINAKFSGTDNSGRFIINFAPNKDTASDITQLNPPELGVQYQTLNDTVQQEIFTGHNVTSTMLFGIKTAGQLGGRTELIEQSELFQNWYVSPNQLAMKIFFDNYIFPFIKGIKGDMELKKQEQIGIDLLGNERAFSILTDDEKRIAIGKDIILKDKKSAESERITSNINTLSPLVANEVLKSMTPNEIRMLAGLPPIKDGDKIKISPTDGKVSFKNEFKADKEKKLLAHLKKAGKKRNGKIISSRPVTFEMSKNLKESEDELRMTFANEKRAVIIGKPIVPINHEPITTPTEIISVVYRYDWDSGFSDKDVITSREFCIELMDESNSGTRWTRQDIEGLDNLTDDPEVSDVWSSRGGWYTKPGTDIHVPHCRHLWYQELIRETI